MESSNNMDISNNMDNTSQPMDIEHTFNIAMNDLGNAQNIALQVEATGNNASDIISSHVAESAIDFIRNLLRTRIIDISENQSESLYNFPAPIVNAPSMMQDGRTINFNHIFSRSRGGILARSFEEDKCKYKKVLSEKGTEDIEYLQYTANEFEGQEKCVFTMRSFEVGDIVAKLPCGHIFAKDSILKWLKEEKASCPVCRYKLDAKEVVNKKEEVDASAINQSFMRNIEFIQHPIRFNLPQYRPSRHRNIIQLMNIIENEQDAREEEELQQAILASLQDISGN